MAYTALYRKFRPAGFSDVRGQDHITTTLKNEIRADRIGHAYLFTGTRGTGKTSVAKVFARAINCESPMEDGSPCGECPVCRAIESGSSLNVTEMDAASNNGVEDVRTIIDEVEYLPAAGRFKVYIIDEVHMFSPAAFNAFLKTLEEPPEHVVFILATTEVHKIPITILSRCQQYDFHRIRIGTIVSRMQEVMDSEGYKIEERALEYIARKADGSMRDALSLLDRCIAFYLTALTAGEALTFDGVLEILGAADIDTFRRMLDAVREHDAGRALSVLDSVVVRGREISRFVTDFSWYLRNLLLIKTSEDLASLIDVSSEDIGVLREQAGKLTEAAILRYISILSDLLYDLARSTQKRTLCEIALIRMMRPQMEKSVEALYQRMGELEQKAAAGALFAAPPEALPAEAAARPEADKPRETKLPEALPEEVKKAAANWKQIAGSAEGMLKTLLMGALVSAGEDGRLLLVYDSEDPVQQTAYRQLSQPGMTESIEKLISGHIGAALKVSIELNRANSPKEVNYTDIVSRFEEKIGQKLEVEDF